MRKIGNYFVKRGCNSWSITDLGELLETCRHRWTWIANKTIQICIDLYYWGVIWIIRMEDTRAREGYASRGTQTSRAFKITKIESKIIKLMLCIRGIVYRMSGWEHRPKINVAQINGNTIRRDLKSSAWNSIVHRTRRRMTCNSIQ